MKKMVFCFVIIMLFAIPVAADYSYMNNRTEYERESIKQHDLDESYTLTRADWLLEQLRIMAYDIEINFDAHVLYSIDNSGIAGNMFLYDPMSQWTDEGISDLKKRVISDANLIAKKYDWSKNIPISARIIFPLDLMEK